MNLDADTIKYINSVVKTAQLLGIDNIIIEPGLVRAIDEARTVVILQDNNVPDMPFGSIGLNRIGVFQSRYEIARVQDKFTIEAVVDEGKFARSLTMKGKGTKIDYRCANPTTITAPRQINDTPLFEVQLTGDAVLLLQRGQAAMGSEQVTILSTKDGVSFEFTDVNSDVFKHTFADTAVALTGESNTFFAHRYPAKTLLSLFKQNPTGAFTVGKAGTLNFPINGLNVTVLPQV